MSTLRRREIRSGGIAGLKTKMSPNSLPFCIFRRLFPRSCLVRLLLHVIESFGISRMAKREFVCISTLFKIF